MNKPFYWIIGGVAAYYIFTKTLLAKKLNFIFSSVNFKGGNIEISFLVQNPSNIGAVVNSVTGNLSVNDRIVANISTFKNQTIPARAETILTITARPQYFGAAQLLIDLYKKKFTAVAKFVGNANVDGVVLPINQTLSI
jgi:hypothetical protein